jgi:leucyl-tRNA synthetase
MINSIADEGESLIMHVMEDVEKIIKVTGMKPSMITIQVAEAWKWELYLRILSIINEGITNYGDVMRMLVKGSSSAGGSDTIATYAKSKPEMVKRMIESILSTPPESRLRRASIGVLDEVRVLCDAIPLLEEEYNCRVEVMVEDSSSSSNSVAKKSALPYRPAIYIR